MPIDEVVIINSNMKKATQVLIFSFCFVSFQVSWADYEEKVGELQSAEKLSVWSPFTEIPETSWETLKMSFSKESIGYWGLILSSTALLYEYDEDLLKEIQRQGRDMGIGNDDKTKPLFQLFGFDVRFPTDTGSSLYFIGDGITHFAIAGSLLGYGAIADHSRPYNTGLQLIHGMTVSTIFNQILKRATGRQAPKQQTEPRGSWRPFPSVETYAAETEAYDAMPSGHVMTTTLAFTIIRDNYPEYDLFLLPLEITCLSLLGWQMVNNGVHWASDYPLGIAMGYVVGKATVKMGKKNSDENSDPLETTWNFLPGQKYGVSTLNLVMTF